LPLKQYRRFTRTAAAMEPDLGSENSMRSTMSSKIWMNERANEERTAEARKLEQA